MSSKQPNQVFVYGSLRQGFNSPAFEYMTRYFNLAGPGKVQGKLYDLGEYPAAIPSSEQAYIVGELFTIKSDEEFNWAMAQLDDYEGVFPAEDEPVLYRRDIATVLLDNGEKQEAWIYWYAGSVEGHPLVTSGDVLQYRDNKQ